MQEHVIRLTFSGHKDTRNPCMPNPMGAYVMEATLSGAATCWATSAIAVAEIGQGVVLKECKVPPRLAQVGEQLPGPLAKSHVPV